MTIKYHIKKPQYGARIKVINFDKVMWVNEGNPTIHPSIHTYRYSEYQVYIYYNHQYKHGHKKTDF